MGKRVKKSLCWERIAESSEENSKSDSRGDRGAKDKKSLCRERIFSKSSTEMKEFLYL